uniref:DNA (cytosine-5)-methyltransferase n=1 Tax=Cacopsylla melanoneura TaxID=428564 RepID=A0A8D8QQ36_9HEMI
MHVKNLTKLKSEYEEIQSDFQSGDLTEKGYCNKLLRTFKSTLPSDVLVLLTTIQNQLAQKKLTDHEYFTQISGILDPQISSILSPKPQFEEKTIDSDTEITEEISSSPLAKRRRIDKTESPNVLGDSAKRFGENPKETKKQTQTISNKKGKPGPRSKTKSKIQEDLCVHCSQKDDDVNVVYYLGHPNKSEEYLVALTDERMNLFAGSQSEDVDLPLGRLNNFTVYCEGGHLCPFDTGMIEKNFQLFLSGYLMGVDVDPDNYENTIPVKDVGPINSWYINHFDGCNKATITLCTPYSEVILAEPSEEYKPIMRTVFEKIYLVKLVVDTCENEEATFEDLLNNLQTADLPTNMNVLTEDHLIRHAQFISDQILDMDDNAGPEDAQLIVTPCVRTLIQLAGVNFAMPRGLSKFKGERVKAAPKQTWSKATTTNLVRDVFESFFQGQLTEKKFEGPRKKRCKVCENCQRPDCGTCTSCLDMIKFGGTGKSKQACVQRRCPNQAVQEADENSEEEEEEDLADVKVKLAKPVWKGNKSKNEQIEWKGDGELCGGKRYYTDVIIGNVEVKVGDFVVVENGIPNSKLPVGKVCYMFEEVSTFHARKCHILWFVRGCDTILGEVSNNHEIFLTESCEDILLSAVADVCTVNHFTHSKDWSMQGGMPPPTAPFDSTDDLSFYYKLAYDEVHARFTDIPDGFNTTEPEVRYCHSCDRGEDEEALGTPNMRNPKDIDDKKVDFYSCVSYEGEVYKEKNCVFVNPDCFKLKTNLRTVARAKKEVDEDVYPETYRKLSDNVKGSNANTPAPFGIGYVMSISKPKGKKNPNVKDVILELKVFYRPENTNLSVELSYKQDLNKLYWSDETVKVPLSEVQGKCYVVLDRNLNVSVEEWSAAGPHRFYFSEAYVSKREEFSDDLPYEAILLGSVSKGIGKNLKNKVIEKEEIKEWPKITRPLKCLDVFAGAGGLSRGLDKSGVTKSTWAIEFDEAAANAYRKNFPKCSVFQGDCNQILQRVIDGNVYDAKGNELPKKGEVEMICGGPPCQGFSGMNRFNERQYSAFKNSLIVSYLAYCDYYRPKYFLLENVRNFVAFKNGAVLKLTLACLTQMGYQCTFGILQAGHFGVSQTRRRAIILAAAPGEVLPVYPEPWTVFAPHTSILNCTISKKTYATTCKWTKSAPYRTITVRDVMSDLPEIRNGSQVQDQYYDDYPKSHFQREMRIKVSEPNVISDHMCKDMSLLVHARIKYIPTQEGADWRDLPNLEIKLDDGTITNKLQYNYPDKKNGTSSTGALRGVCACAKGGPCEPSARQFGTLIPWCLPHTGNRHNNWCGLYGRLSWDGFFSTTITNPEPMGKQGRVLHPEQNRVVSVRECARSQGFPDHHKFHGTILEKHRQVGNAVPPPMGEALGRELKKALAQKEKMEIEKKNQEQSEEQEDGQREELELPKISNIAGSSKEKYDWDMYSPTKQPSTSKQCL